MNKQEIQKELLQVKKEIAELLNCAQVTYSNYETGKRCIPIQSLIKLAKFYNVSIDYNNKFLKLGDFV